MYMIITVILPLQCHGFCYCSRSHTVCCIQTPCCSL